MENKRFIICINFPENAILKTTLWFRTAAGWKKDFYIEALCDAPAFKTPGKQQEEDAVMQITDIKIRKLIPEGRLRAIISITLDDMLAVHDIKVVQGDERLFVAMPSRRDENGVFRDIVHPITAETRQLFEAQILDAYVRYFAEHEPILSAHGATNSLKETGEEQAEEMPAAEL